MYSDMSIRTIASSVSNMNSASARASSVLPTPVGPEEEEASRSGRSGSWSPARERRSAFETASTASSWPITRSCRRSSMWISFSTSPSSSCETGMPVHSRDDLGDVLVVDLLLEEARSLRRRSARLGVGERAARARGSRRSAARRRARGRRRARRARPRGGPARAAPCGSRDRGDRLLLGLPLRPSSRRALAQLGQLALDRLAARDARLVGLLLERLAARSRAA